MTDIKQILGRNENNEEGKNCCLAAILFLFLK